MKVLVTGLGILALLGGAAAIAAGDVVFGIIVIVFVGLSWLVPSTGGIPRDEQPVRRQLLAWSIAWAVAGIISFIAGVFLYVPHPAVRSVGIVGGIAALFISFKLFQASRRIRARH